jgi:hypothetical protein
VITVRLMGGLGNQMFQYACGRRLAIRQGVALTLDRRWFDSIDVLAHEVYSLGSFRLCSGIRFLPASEHECPPRRHRKVSVSRALRNTHSWPRSAFHEVIEERSFALDRRVLNASGRTYLDGFWQREDYFSDVAPLIRHEFSLRAPLVGEAAALAEQAAESDTVSLHVRRADYRDALPAAYYREALAEMHRRLPDPKLYVFSDDLEWARRELGLSDTAIFVDFLPGGQPWVDMVAMSRCRHHIISNSTYSWWGAWLSPWPDTVVLAPRVWFLTDHRMESDFNLPSSWTRL